CQAPGAGLIYGQRFKSRDYSWSRFFYLTYSEAKGFEVKAVVILSHTGIVSQYSQAPCFAVRSRLAYGGITYEG
ncbi:MAG: hypothetical protein ACM3UW_08275, partial [Bacillota bacterium]